MDAWLMWARGPFFLFALSFMLLGLIRHLVLTVWEIGHAVRRAGDKTIPYRKIAIATIKWMVPIGKLRNRIIFGLTSLLFHIGVILVPIFLAGHIALWRRGLGVSWPALPNSVADVLTIAAVLTTLALIVQRLGAQATRELSRFQDYFLPLVIALPFASGYLVMHPEMNPFPFDATLLVHVMSANLVMILAPITKLSHMVLVPSTQLISEVGWHWPADSGTRVAVALGKEGEPI